MAVNRKAFVFLILGVFVSLPSFAFAESPDISKGQRSLLDWGLQIHALTFISETGYFDTARWAESNFTAVDMYTMFPTDLMPAAPGIPWSRWLQDPETDLKPLERAYVSNLVRIQVGDEQNITDTAVLADLAETVAELHAKYPNVIVHTVQPTIYSATQIRNYMAQVQPDMLMFDAYPFHGTDYMTGGLKTYYYENLEMYRRLGLAGNDGTGNNPIPVGCYLQTFVSDYYTGGHIVSESEIRLNQFSAWAYGCKIVDAFIYDNNQHASSIGTIMFEGNDTETPTAKFYEIAETNRQSRNIGKSLTRLISTDVRMKMGQHLSGSTVVTNTLPDNNAWTSADDPYMTSVTATNLGTLNNGLRGDVIVSYFKPLDSVFVEAGAENDVYFMITNGLVDPNGSAADCSQNVHLEFDFGTSGINQLLRISRGTGEVEPVALTHNSGSQYSLDLVLEGGTGDLFKYDNGYAFVTEPAKPEVHYTFRETAPGTWEVLVDITGGTTGLSAYEFWVDGVDPGTVSFTENRLGTFADGEYVGFSPANCLSGDIGGSFNAGNFQASGATAIEGIGMSDVYIDGLALVDLDAQALLGILTTEEGLTEENFRATVVGLLNEFNDGFYDADGIVPTVEVIPFEVLLPGDANRDGVVSAGDYAAVQANFGNTGEPGILGDANGDGVVSAGDYASVQANFGNVAGSVVPEPATISLLMVGLSLICRKKNE